jgi:hypothetical protein
LIGAGPSPRRASNTSVPRPRFTATSAPMPLAQKPSILPSSIAFAALTPNDTPAGLAGIGGGAICTLSRLGSMPYSFSISIRPISMSGAAPMRLPLTAATSPRFTFRSARMIRNQ